MSVLAVHNSTAFGKVLTRQRDRFNLLIKRKAMVHHYTEFMDIEEIKIAEEDITNVISQYQAIESGDTSLITKVNGYDNLADLKLLPSF